jgi:hypothetical protein
MTPAIHKKRRIDENYTINNNNNERTNREGLEDGLIQ